MATVEQTFDAFSIQRVVPLPSRYYYYFLRDAIESARYRIWGSIFLVNVRREDDHHLEVRDIVKLVSLKRRLGLNVKFIVGHSETTPSIQEANDIARRYMRTRNIPVRRYSGSKSSTHSKYIIVDDLLAIIGSHNWTPNAFGANEEDSVAIYSKGVTRELGRQFMASWVATG